MLRIKAQQKFARFRKRYQKAREYINALADTVEGERKQIQKLQDIIQKQAMQLMAYRYDGLESGEIHPGPAGYVMEKRVQKPIYDSSTTPVLVGSKTVGECETISERVEVFEIWMRRAKPELLEAQQTISRSRS